MFSEVSTRRILVAGLLFTVLSIGFLGGLLVAQDADDRFSFLTSQESLSQCVDRMLARGGVNESDNFISYCWALLYNQAQLNEFNIRRVVFRNQHVSDQILLWMVVTLTISGVVLAGMQMIASYNFARSAGQGDNSVQQEFSIEKGKLVFRSAVTGLFILLFSFAFFYIYVKFVYKIDELRLHSEFVGGGFASDGETSSASPSESSSGPELSGGGLGTPVEEATGDQAAGG